MNLWKQFKNWFIHSYAEGLVDNHECDRCLVKRFIPKIEHGMKEVAKHCSKKRYGCPQDYDTTKEFLDSI